MPPGGGVPASAYPAYVSAQYIQWLTGEDPSDYSAVDANLPSRAATPYNMKTMLESAFAAGNPYDVGYAYDPIDLLDVSQEKMDEALTAIEAVSPTTDWGGYVDAAVAKLDSFLPTDGTTLDTEVEEFRQAQLPAYEQALNAFAGGMVEINAVGGSAFAFGVAQLRSRFESDLLRHRSQLELALQRERVLFITQAASEMLRSQQFRIGSLQSATQLQAELNRVAIVANSQYLEQELSYEVERLYWDLGLFKFGAQTLASIAGVASPERGLSRTASALSGAITGGSQLAALGAQAGPQAAVLLGLAGALVGGYGGYATA